MAEIPLWSAAPLLPRKAFCGGEAERHLFCVPPMRMAEQSSTSFADGMLELLQLFCFFEQSLKKCCAGRGYVLGC